jgi:Zn-finger nucleic acid-binding protein
VSAGCPRCQKPLETAQVDTIQVRLCQACRGVLLAHSDLVQILEASWRAVSEKQAEETQFRASEGWQKEMVLRCPDCGQIMEKYGYMGLGAIQIDRCDPCNLVWLDTNELQNMILALAKSNYHSEHAMKMEQEGALDLAQGCLPPVGHAGNLWLFPKSESGPEVAVSVALQLLQLVLK